jgi:hypothetical protein
MRLAEETAVLKDQVPILCKGTFSECFWALAFTFLSMAPKILAYEVRKIENSEYNWN